MDNMDFLRIISSQMIYIIPNTFFSCVIERIVIGNRTTVRKKATLTSQGILCNLISEEN